MSPEWWGHLYGIVESEEFYGPMMWDLIYECEGAIV